MSRLKASHQPPVTPQMVGALLVSLNANAEHALRLRQRTAALDARQLIADAPPGSRRTRRSRIEFRSLHGEDLWMWDVLGRPTDGYFIEIGAGDGYRRSSTYALEAMGWHGVLVESSAELCEECRRLRPHSRVVCSAATLDEILAEHGGPGAIDAVIIRAGGAELDVLHGFDLLRRRPRILLIEDASGGQNPALANSMADKPYVQVGWVHTTALYIRDDEAEALDRSLKPKVREEEDQHWAIRMRDVLGCPDNDRIPRVPGAGSIVDGVQIMHNGLRIKAGSYYGGRNTRLLELNKGVHEPQEEWVFQETLPHVRPDAVMLELGAYWGFYSMWFLHGHPGRRAILVEPDPANLHMGRSNFAINGLHGEFVHAGVGAAPATDEHGRRTVCVDELVEQFGLDRIDILHCDIQGFEDEMLVGAKKTIAQRKIDHVFLSTHGPDRHRRCSEALRSSGFEIVADANMDDTYSFDGLLVARRAGLSAPGPVAISRKSVHGLRG